MLVHGMGWGGCRIRDPLPYATVWGTCVACARQGSPCASPAPARPVAPCVALVCMQAAQPALLYIVPGVLGCVAAHAAARGELRELWAWNEGGGEGDAPAGQAGAAAAAGETAAAEGKKDQ
jgi:hypothetical protein